MPEGAWPPPCDGLFAAGFVPMECKPAQLTRHPRTPDLQWHMRNISATESERYSAGPGQVVQTSEAEAHPTPLN